MAAEAVRAAIDDAGLLPSGEVDGLVTFTLDTNDELALMRSVGITGTRWTSPGRLSAVAAPRRAPSSMQQQPWPVEWPRWSSCYRAFNDVRAMRFGPATTGLRPRKP